MTLKRNLFSLFIAVVSIGLVAPSCSLDDDSEEQMWNDTAAWREANEQWLAEMEASVLANGQKEYTRVVPAWNQNAWVLMKWYNDTMLTCGNLRPLYTSTVDVKYIGRLYNDEPFDSSFVNTQYGDSIFRTKASAVIQGWTIALERMHVGDSVQVLIPYSQGYGATNIGTVGTSNFIPAYSALQFSIKLVDVVGEYVRP